MTKCRLASGSMPSDGQSRSDFRVRPGHQVARHCYTKMSVATWKRSLGLLGIEWRERVESVSSQMQEAAALVAKGVDKTRLQAQGHGASNPIADNTTEDGRGKNLRVKLVRVGA
jgi:hypothetical protein